MNFEVLILGQKMSSEYKPPEYKPPEYKPPKKCLRTSISPGLIFGILRYFDIVIWIPTKILRDYEIDPM